MQNLPVIYDPASLIEHSFLTTLLDDYHALSPYWWGTDACAWCGADWKEPHYDGCFDLYLSWSKETIKAFGFIPSFSLI